MFSMKISNKNNGPEATRTIKGMISYIFDKLKFENSKMVSDDLSVELVSGSEEFSDNDGVIIELVIRKHIVINTADFNDRQALDKHIAKIKHFCDQAKEIEDLKYLPINMRSWFAIRPTKSPRYWV